MPTFGILNYDIPYKNRSANRRILKKLRRLTIMETASCYFVPWAYRDSVDAVMVEEQRKDPRIRYFIRPYDASADAAIVESVVDAMHRNIRANKDAIGLAILRLEEAMDDQTPSEIDAIDLVPVAHRAIKRSKKHLEDAKAAALCFSMSDNLLPAFVAYEELIQSMVAELEAKKALLSETE
jgi:hypothetical protein